MSYSHETATLKILKWFHRAESHLLGNVVSTFNGETGVVKELRLDDVHGLCFTFDDPSHPFDTVERGIVQRFYPVSTIKHKATDHVRSGPEVSEHDDATHRGDAQARE